MFHDIGRRRVLQHALGHALLEHPRPARHVGLINGSLDERQQFLHVIWLITAYLLGEVAAASMIPLIWVLISPFGLAGAGVAALMAALIAFTMYFTQAKLRHEVEISGENLRLVLLLVAFLTAVAFLFQMNAVVGLVVGLAGAAAMAWHSFSALRSVLRPK